MKKYKCMDCLTSFEAEYKEDCPSCGDDSDVIEVSAHTDKLSVEKFQEIRVEELKDFNSKILQAELENQKLQKEIDAAKKYIEESYKADKEDNKLLDLIIEAVAKLKSDNETLKKALTEIASSRQWRGGTFVGFEATEDAQIAINALAAIGNEGSGDE
jgi:DNA repair exonuclease SbcCD ATPase subunit|nr:MAG TPA: DNA-directed RNA polymerase [Caudoviricetes sp.]